MHKLKVLFKLYFGNDILCLNQVSWKSVKCDNTDPFSQAKDVIIMFVGKPKLCFGKPRKTGPRREIRI